MTLFPKPTLGIRFCCILAALLSAGAAQAAPDLLALAETHQRAAQALDRQRRLPEASAEWIQVIQYQPHWSEGYMGLAWDLRDAGRSPEAERVLREAVRVNPTSFDCWYGIGDMLEEQGRMADSVIPFLKSVQLNPKNWMGYYQLSGVYNALGQWRNARLVAAAWVRRQPGSVDAHDALGYDDQKCGDPVGGAAQYRQALKLDPADLMAHDNLGCILAESGHRAAAHALWYWVLAHPTSNHVHPDGTAHNEGFAADVRQMLLKYP